MEHNFYDEDNPIVVDSIRRTCGAFDRIRNVQKGTSFNMSKYTVQTENTQTQVYGLCKIDGHLWI